MIEIKRYVPEIVALGLPEVVAAAGVVGRAEGNPLPLNEIIITFAFYTSVGIPAAIAIYVLRHINVAREGTGFRFTPKK